MTEMFKGGAPVKIQFALVSHTNNGKTTLARTLVGMDVGEVRDAAHVTQFAEAHPLQASEAGVTVTAALFSLSATPEKENHGAFLDYLSKHVPRGVAVLVDESPLVERIGEQQGNAARVAERTALWRQFCSFHGTSATFVNLLQPEKYPLELGAGLSLPELR